MQIKGKRVFVGLSGGVDSAVTAALLKEQGADIVGVFIKGWYPPGMPCTWSDDRKDAMRVAAALQIPFHTLDASTEYKQGVIDYLLAEYRAGRTPNPDVMCNREVKFGAFYRFAKENGADHIATGHYARAQDGILSRGTDSAKDQSYFLWAVPKEAIAMTLFPLGEMKKDATRKLANKYRLPNAVKKDSQGICFLGSISVDEFLRMEFSPVPGDAVDTDGAPIGRHGGAILHTLGARIALADAPAGPWYVVRKDIGKNLIVVSKERVLEEAPSGIRLTQANWFDAVPEGVIQAQFRYHGPIIDGTWSSEREEFMPSAPLPEPLAPGQSLVLYKDNVVIGGGIIA
jgi:tRNA-specific 2-thiouridylase